jgi:predicted MFS family arabinose efflux permease
MSFIGASLGSAIGLTLWEWKGWQAICIACGIMAILAVIVYLSTYKKLKYKTL